MQTFDDQLLSSQAIEFLDLHGDAPFFLYIAPYAPHFPAIPSPEDSELFADYVYRERGYGETDLSDKPGWVVQGARSYNVGRFGSMEQQDAFHRDRLRTLQGVDRLVEQVVDWLDDNDKLENTIVFYTSDNGFLLGEHGLFEKNIPYQESIRVPLVVRGSREFGMADRI